MKPFKRKCWNCRQEDFILRNHSLICRECGTIQNVTSRNNERRSMSNGRRN